MKCLLVDKITLSAFFPQDIGRKKKHNSLSCFSFPLTHCHTHNSSDTTFFPYTMQFSVTSARYLTIPFNSILT